MHILLHVHVARAGEIWILVADGGSRDRERTVRVLGPVDKTEQVAVVEEPETVHLVDHGHRAAHRPQNAIGQLETGVQRLGPNMEQQVAGRVRRSVSRAVQLDEWVQLGRSRTGEQPVPGLRADRGDHRQMLGGVAESDCPRQAGDLWQRIVHRRLAALVDCDNQEDGGRRQRSQNGLRLHRLHRLLLGHGFDPNVPMGFR